MSEMIHGSTRSKSGMVRKREKGQKEKEEEGEENQRRERS